MDITSPCPRFFNQAPTSFHKKSFEDKEKHSFFNFPLKYFVCSEKGCIFATREPAKPLHDA